MPHLYSNHSAALSLCAGEMELFPQMHLKSHILTLLKRFPFHLFCSYLTVNAFKTGTQNNLMLKKIISRRRKRNSDGHNMPAPLSIRGVLWSAVICLSPRGRSFGCVLTVSYCLCDLNKERHMLTAGNTQR